MIWLLGGSLVLALVPQSTPYFVFLLVAGALGFGFGLVITITTVTAQAVVAPDQVGVATSFNTLSRTLGQTLMVSVYGIVLNLRLTQGIAADSRLNSNMLNELINPHTAKNLPAAVLPTLRQILYEGLHNIYFFSIIIVALAILANHFEAKRVLTKETIQESNEES